jgi:hypothetical protein
MTDTTITPKDEPTTPPSGGGTGEGTNGSHETNGGAGGTTASPNGSHETNDAPTGTTV